MTPNLRTRLAYPDAQLIHLHGLICAAHALPLSRIIAQPSLSASVEEGKQDGTDQKPRSQFVPRMEWSRDALTVEYEETPLAQYTVRYQPDKKHFKATPDAKRFETPNRSPQGWLWELDETLWHLAKRLPDYAPRKKRRKKPMPLQLPLLEDPPVAQE